MLFRSTSEISSEQRLSVAINTRKFTQDTETIKIEMIQGGIVTTVYEKVHSKSEGDEILIQRVVRGSGSARIVVYYGNVIELEQTIEF